MSGRNRIVLVALPLVALAIGFWILLVSPKREEASTLEAQAVELRAQVDEQEQLLAAAEAAREEFPRTYRRLVVLGKAAPEDDDTSSLLVQLERIADKANVNFAGLETASGEAAAPEPAAAPQTPADTAETQEGRAEGAEGTAPPAPAPATEAHAALLPIGATVGPAGLPVMRYTLDFQGDFFHLADFVAGLDSLVRTQNGGKVGIRGRLVTIDGFELAAADESSDLTATFTITTYLTPPEQGITAGASPAGPPPASTATASATPTAPPAASTTPPPVSP